MPGSKEKDDPNSRWQYQGHPLILPVAVVIIGFLLFSGLVIGYTTWAVTSSEHKWCAVINTLNAAPPPPSPVTNAERQYDTNLILEFRALKIKLGC